jgi:hypothetical protein
LWVIKGEDAFWHAFEANTQALDQATAQCPHFAVYSDISAQTHYKKLTQSPRNLRRRCKMSIKKVVILSIAVLVGTSGCKPAKLEPAEPSSTPDATAEAAPQNVAQDDPKADNAPATK